MQLNRRAFGLCRSMLEDAPRLRLEILENDDSGRVIDCGVKALGGLEAGKMLAEISMAGLGRVEIVPAPFGSEGRPAVSVRTDHPVAACLAAQYAGWKVEAEGFFAMGSGPMRALAAREKLYETLGYRESDYVALGVLECSQVPPAEVVRMLARECGVEDYNLTLLVARTASLAGTVQVVARSVETALHKLLELGFDVRRIECAWGVSPLPPVAADDLTAIGRTNDAILYGSQVTLWCRGDETSLAEIGPRLPSNASPDHGRPFLELFERYDRDFYRVDPMLFAPAVVHLQSLDTGRSFRFGTLVPELLG